MSVTLNEAALFELLNSPQGPVAAEITRRAEDVVELAQAKAFNIMQRFPGAAALVTAIDFAMDEKLWAFIGIEDEGRMTEYLGEKAIAPKEGSESWLLSAFEQGWNL